MQKNDPLFVSKEIPLELRDYTINNSWEELIKTLGNIIYSLNKESNSKSLELVKTIGEFTYSRILIIYRGHNI